MKIILIGCLILALLIPSALASSLRTPLPIRGVTPSPEPTPAPTLKRVERVTLRPIPTATPEPTLPPPLDFKAVNRNPDNYAMQTYTITGTVVQSIETAELRDDKTYRTHLRVAVDDDHDQIILVLYDRPYTADRVLEDDRITFSGVVYGLTSYEAINGRTITLPYFGLMELYSIEAGD